MSASSTSSLSDKRRDGIRVRWNLHTFSLIGIVGAMWYAGAVQANGAALFIAILTALLGGISYVHARANLRGLEIRLGSIPRSRQGEASKLPVILSAKTGHSPHGLEVLMAGSTSAVLVDKVPSGGAVTTTVPLPQEEAGTQGQIRLVFRSSYPLGLFSAERLVTLEGRRTVHPRPEGSLPPPAPVAHRLVGHLAGSSASARPSRSGDDFAGLREWQLGDSPRHIDWRAAARGRPLMVKTWAGQASGVVEMQWDLISLPEAERASQIAQWIQQCEREGTPYSLQLPNQKLVAGLGEAHARRCLDALAHFAGEQATLVDPKGKRKNKRLPASFERMSHLPAEPLLWLCLALFLISLSLLNVASLLSFGILLLCLLWRAFKLPIPGRWLPLTVIAVGVPLVYWTFGEFSSLEARISTLLILLGGKLLESKTPHDFQVLAMIGWFFCLCNILAEQDLARVVFTLILFAGITVCMVRFRRAVPGMRVPFRVAGSLLAPALPVALVLFLVFPRLDLQNIGRLGSNRFSKTGIPSELNPGRIAQVAKTGTVAFRAAFPNSTLPNTSERYWRCLVLWHCEGMRWTRGNRLPYQPRWKNSPGPQVRQVITLEPHGERWLPALDRPTRIEDQGAILRPDFDGTLASDQPVENMRRFEAFSQLVPEVGELSPAYRMAALQLPAQLSPALRELTEQWKAGAVKDSDIVMEGLGYLAEQGFKYALDPGEYTGEDNLEDFLLRRKIGFCEHFSAGFGTLMRMAGIPTRVVMGYLGGEYSEGGGYMIVRQSDAHAWLEVWLEETGWTRVDPTVALAPGRMNLGLSTFLEGGEEALARQRGSLWWRTSQAARLFWDNLNYDWYEQVIGFNQESQLNWLRWLGVENLRKRWLLGISAGVILLSLIGLTLWLRRPARHDDPWARAWLDFCRRLAKSGVSPRTESEGPLAYAERLSHEGHPQAVLIQQLAGQYAAARYGSQAESLTLFQKTAQQVFAALKVRQPKAIARSVA